MSVNSDVEGRAGEGRRPGRTIEDWCTEFVLATDLETKLAPPEPPDPRSATSWDEAPVPVRLVAPGRPVSFDVRARALKTPKPGALARPEARAQLVHTFLHHELQAAELFAWAVLAFPDAPREFRAGLVRLLREELEHLALYRTHLADLGYTVGTFPVRDWFWERGSRCAAPAEFIAFVGLGLEGANLEHTARFADAFRAVGDEAGAALQERIGRDEERHVAFAVRWFRRFEGRLDFQTWAARLPRPLSPAPLRGLPLNRAARKRAGLDDAFLDALEAVPPATVARDAGDVERE